MKGVMLSMAKINKELLEKARLGEIDCGKKGHAECVEILGEKLCGKCGKVFD